MTKVISSLDELQSFAGGEAFAASDWIPVDQALIDSFAAVSGDRQWIHVDPERALQGPFGSIIAHGFLTLSLISQMASQAVSLQLGQTASINYGLNRVRFPAPVPAGRSVRGHFSLLTCSTRPAGLEVIWRVSVEAEGVVKPVCVAEWVLLFVLGPP